MERESVCCGSLRRVARFACVSSLILLSLILAAVLLASDARGPEPARAQGGSLIADGTFDAASTGVQLRRQEKAQGWYESRKDTKAGRRLLQLSTKPIGGNATHKARIKGSRRYNTYLTQAFQQPQKARFSTRWDIYVSEIHPKENRSAFQMIGATGAKGPNGTGAQRFVFLAFENATTPGKVNLIAMEGGAKGKSNQRTVLVRNLDMKKWYTVAVDVDVKARSYAVSIPGVTQRPVPVKAFSTGTPPPSELTHISFSSWNDGPGTFFVDNVK